MPIIFHLPKKNSALVHIRNVVRHRMVFPSFRSHVFSCVGAVRIQKKLPTNYNNMSVLMYLKFRFPKIGINCITFKMAIVSNKLKMAHRSHLIPPPLFFVFALLSCILNSNVKETRPWVRLESTLMENWRGGRHFFDDGILCLSTLLLFSSVRVSRSPFSRSSCVCTVLSS